jgi:ribonuclease E
LQAKDIRKGGGRRKTEDRRLRRTKLGGSRKRGNGRLARHGGGMVSKKVRRLRREGKQRREGMQVREGRQGRERSQGRERRQGMEVMRRR